jgi:hypothetical protein
MGRRWNKAFEDDGEKERNTMTYSRKRVLQTHDFEVHACMFTLLYSQYKEIDRIARERKTTRSAIFREAVEKFLEDHRKQEAKKKFRRVA